MVYFPQKNVFTVFMILLSIGVLIILGEVGVRLFVKNGDISPRILRNRSVKYEPVVFARHAFKQEARLIKHTFGSKKGLVWEINEKGYRGPNFEEKKQMALLESSFTVDLLLSIPKAQKGKIGRIGCKEN